MINSHDKMESLPNREWDDDLGKNQVVLLLHHAPPQTSKDYPILSQHNEYVRRPGQEI
jgi:hypothetical protein